MAFFFFCAFPFYLFSFDQYNCKTSSFFLRCVFVNRSIFAEHLYFFFFWIASSFTAFFFFLIVFDRKRRLSPFLQAEIRLLHFLVYNGLFYYPSYPLFFCFYVWDFVGERSLPLYVSSVYAVHTLWKKKKKSGWMSYLAIFGTHALLVHILWQFWRWNAESGCPSHGSRSARKCKKKKEEAVKNTFFFGVFAVAES